VKNSMAMKLDSFNNFWETRTIQHKLAKFQHSWVAEGQNEVFEGRDSLGVVDGEVNKFLTDGGGARGGLEDVGNIFNSC
jgi:hypothetical protein